MTLSGLVRNRWAFAPVVLLLASAGSVIGMARIAADDPGFSLEPKYYEKAVKWDLEQATWAENARLGWRLRAEVAPGGTELVARLALRDGSPLTSASVAAEAFPVARAGEVVRLSFAEQEPGVYAVSLDRPRPGLWELRFQVRREKESFSKTARVEVIR